MRPVPAFLAGAILSAAATGSILRLLPSREGARPADSGHESEPEQITVWSDDYEIFAEHPPLREGIAAEFLLHVTDLKTFEPLRKGPVALSLRRGGGPPLDVSVETPSRPGVFRAAWTPPAAGEWDATIRLPREEVRLPHLHVAGAGAGAAAHDHDHAGDPGDGDPPGEAVPFLKEQQWLLGVKTAPAARRTLVERLPVPGEVQARPGSRVELTPPVAGQLVPLPGREFPRLGDSLTAGQAIAAVQPPLTDLTQKILEAEASAARASIGLEQAEAAAERIRKLVAERARPDRDLQDALFAVRQARADRDGAEAVRSAYGKSGAILVDGRPAFEIRSPIAGIVTRIDRGPGEHVDPDRPILAVVDPAAIHIIARVPEAAMARLPQAPGASWQGAASGGVSLPLDALRVWIQPEVDPLSRTVSIVFEPSASSRLPPPGSSLALLLETSRQVDALAVPASAIVEEPGMPVAFVQAAGETFRKRPVVLGIRDGEWIQVLRGIGEGERIVVEGAFAVRLASVAAQVPAHGHAH